MLHNQSAPPGTIVPRLIYDDVAAAIDWLCGAFGFVERLRTPAEADGTIHHAQLAYGLGSVILTGHSAEFRGEPKGHALRPGQFSEGLMVRVEDAQAHYEQARNFGAKIISLPKRCEFGEIQYSAEDREGKRWTFTQSFADVDPTSWGAKIAKIERHSMGTIQFYSTKDKFGEFSNFSPHEIELDGKSWPTSEHYFQAQKFADADQREAIRKAKGAMIAARMGRDRGKKLKDDWEQIKIDVMTRAVRAKFTQHADLRAILLGTGDATLVEHTRNDAYWGDGGDGSGKNMLGQILMKIRDELRSQDSRE
ncbi:MAG TPA: NADAR domain-containing protein [Tepidisphaeraceae bacterium]|nr:NADAR domain-containing protein [Tepidisphaeraceae bacterium]